MPPPRQKTIVGDCPKCAQESRFGSLLKIYARTTERLSHSYCKYCYEFTMYAGFDDDDAYEAAGREARRRKATDGYYKEGGLCRVE